MHATKSRSDLAIQVDRNLRRLTAQRVLCSQAVAQRFGLHKTDLQCLDLIFLRGQISAGEFAAAANLTSGATTALIDRLEAAGYIERVPDPADRRRVNVRISPRAMAPIKSIFEPLFIQQFDLWASYGQEELAVIADFLDKTAEIFAKAGQMVRDEEGIAVLAAANKNAPARRRPSKAPRQVARAR